MSFAKTLITVILSSKTETVSLTVAGNNAIEPTAIVILAEALEVPLLIVYVALSGPL